MAGGNGGAGGQAAGDGVGGPGGNGEGPRLIDQLVVHQVTMILLASSQHSLLRDILASSIPLNTLVTSGEGRNGGKVPYRP